MKYYFKNEPSSLLASFSSREGGVSLAPYDSLNLGLSAGDNRDHVLVNRDLFFKANNLLEENCAFAKQTHSDTIAYVQSSIKVENCDGLYTNVKNLPLIISVADCACIYVYDKKNKVIGLLHSGWRGTQKKILLKCIDLWQEKFNSQADDIHVQISPCLSQENFEVGKEFLDLFDAKYLKAKEDKFLLDMKQCLIDQAKEYQIKNIQIDSACTYTDKNLYFSYRRDRENSGRMFGLFMLK